MNGRPAVFFDRDGTINEERGYLGDPDDLALVPGALDAVRAVAAAGLLPIIVTSQSGIARGMYTETALARVHEALHRQLEGLPVAYLHCPHHPDLAGPYGGACACRKPADGMLDQATELLGATLEGSAIVGDSARDLLMGRHGPARTVLVRTGKPWREQLAVLEAEGRPPDHVADDVGAAVRWLLGD